MLQFLTDNTKLFISNTLEASAEESERSGEKPGLF